ncbi:hypothetical protein ACIBKY_03810 [Nonomuraea sp. NPDC050394]|uniref:hypothetical protein n=1 Tax=Nonomuraea sp. NPDC050394 TaxID=3364363 RepID=UPI003797B722
MDRIVEGYLDGVYYAVTVGEVRPGAAASVGVTSGSVQACRLLEFRNGMALPDSGNRLDVNDPEAVIAALQELTHVISVRPAGTQ